MLITRALVGSSISHSIDDPSRGHAFQQIVTGSGEALGTPHIGVTSREDGTGGSWGSNHEGPMFNFRPHSGEQG